MPYESAIIGLKFLIRLDDLKADHAVEVRCPSCEVEYLVAPHHLHDRYPAYTRLVEIAKEMVCRRCARRGDLYWRILRAVCKEELHQRELDRARQEVSGGAHDPDQVSGD